MCEEGSVSLDPFACRVMKTDADGEGELAFLSRVRPLAEALMLSSLAFAKGHLTVTNFEKYRRERPASLLLNDRS